MVERFKRGDVDTISHEVAVTAPMAFTGSWTVPFLLTKADEGLYEHVCQEGTYGMTNLMSYTRVAEKSTAAATKTRKSTR